MNWDEELRGWPTAAVRTNETAFELTDVQYQAELPGFLTCTPVRTCRPAAGPRS